MPSINKSRILIMATHGFEQSELVKPLEQLKAKGAKVEVAAPEPGQINGWQKNNWGTPVDVDLTSISFGSAITMRWFCPAAR